MNTIGLLIIAAALFALLLYDRNDKKQRLAAFAALLLGAALVVAAIPGLLPEASAAAKVSEIDGRTVLTIDRSNDYAGGLPGNLFDAGRTRHMIRNSMRGFMWCPAGGAPPFSIGWAFKPPRAGRYELRVRYASEESRPGEIRLEDQVVFTGLAQTTASRLKPEWFTEGTIELREGFNHLTFYSERPLPNIDSLQLALLD